MTPITKSLTIIGAIVGMCAMLCYTMYTPSPWLASRPHNTGLSLVKTQTKSLMSAEQKATSHICEAYAWVKRHRPTLTEPPNFYDWLQVSTVVVVEEEVVRVLEHRNTPSMDLQKRMLRDPDSDVEAYMMGSAGDRMTDSVRQRQLEIDVDTAIAYVLLREEEKNIYTEVFVPLLDDRLIDKAWSRSKWDRVKEKCKDL